MNRMFADKFGKPVKRINPCVGCSHKCKYCWARPFFERHKGAGIRSGEWETPQLVESVLEVPVRWENETIAPCLMGDLFCRKNPKRNIYRVLDWLAAADRSNTIMPWSKNPGRFIDFYESGDKYSNFIWGATIETDNDALTKYYSPGAPAASERMGAMKELKRLGARTAVSVEPILLFNDFSDFLYGIEAIEPEVVYVGYDTRKQHLIEPNLPVAEMLVRMLRKSGYDVREKLIRERWY